MNYVFKKPELRGKKTRPTTHPPANHITVVDTDVVGMHILMYTDDVVYDTLLSLRVSLQNIG